MKILTQTLVRSEPVDLSRLGPRQDPEELRIYSVEGGYVVGFCEPHREDTYSPDLFSAWGCAPFETLDKALEAGRDPHFRGFSEYPAS